MDKDAGDLFRTVGHGWSDGANRSSSVGEGEQLDGIYVCVKKLLVVVAGFSDGVNADLLAGEETLESSRHAGLRALRGIRHLVNVSPELARGLPEPGHHLGDLGVGANVLLANMGSFGANEVIGKFLLDGLVRFGRLDVAVFVQGLLEERNINKAVGFGSSLVGGSARVGFDQAVINELVELSPAILLACGLVSLAVGRATAFVRRLLRGLSTDHMMSVCFNLMIHKEGKLTERSRESVADASRAFLACLDFCKRCTRVSHLKKKKCMEGEIEQRHLRAALGQMPRSQSL